MSTRTPPPNLQLINPRPLKHPPERDFKDWLTPFRYINHRRFPDFEPPPLPSKRFHCSNPEYLDCIITGAHSLFTGRFRINTPSPSPIRFSPIAPPFNCRHYSSPPLPFPLFIPPGEWKYFARVVTSIRRDSWVFVDAHRHVFGCTGPINHPTASSKCRQLRPRLTILTLTEACL